MRFVSIVIGALVGGALGYEGGALLACLVLWPESNLCGLLGAFVTGPLGLVAGGVAGRVIWRHREPK
jgi:hypothetical protein